ncbi:unnamed protein product, partial [Symbiodinium necroappetens]
MFLELIEGCGRHIRAHDGQCFFYTSHGHWAAYNGVIPQGTLARCKSYLMYLEGLYSKFGPNTPRNEDGILAAAQAILSEHNGSCAMLLSECARAAICRVPPANAKSKQAGQEKEEDEEHGKGGYTSWTTAMANTIGKLYVKLQTSLLNDTVIKYYVAWCSKDVQRQGGFCTLDGCFVFEQDGGLITVARNPEANVYIFIPHRMLDPIPEEVKHRVKVFWNTTYWGNGPAFEVCMASWTLALRGENVDRAFWGIGSGGVGWKRFELNTYPFSGVTEETLDSMLRRTVACRYKACFVDPQRIAGKEAEAAASGVFPRDPTLKDFLRDKPACLVTLRFLWNYARGHTADQCRTVLENYVVHGGDEGLTRIAVRTSCGLSVDNEGVSDRVQQVLAALTVEGARQPEQVDEMARARQAKKEEQQKISDEIKTWLRDEGKDWFTAAQAKVAKASVSFGRGEAANVVQELARDGYLLSQTRDLPKAG